jgi:hypothetical protein
MSPMQPGDILLTEKLLILYIIELQNICCFINPNQLYVEYTCFALSTLEYVQIYQ